MSRPNIIFIQSDSMDGRAMGCAGQDAARTPNMDAVARQGALFRNTYCNSPQCCPSRASMWSGRYVHSVEAWNNHKGLAPDTATFLTSLDAAGYRTAVLGRTDHLSGAHSLANRLSIWTRSAGITATVKSPPQAVREDDKGARVRELDWERTDGAVRWLEENAHASDAPFFLYVGFTQPHPGDGFRTSPHYLDLIDPREVTLPATESALHPVMAYMRATKNCMRVLPNDEILRIRRHYYAMIAELDAMVGEVLGAADGLGLLENTWVIYTSDHGEMNMEHGQYLKNAMYEASIRVPLVLRGPGVPPGRTVDDLVSLVDMFPTLMDIAKTDKPAFLEGQSLLPLLGGDSSGRSGRVLSEYHSNMQNTGSFMLREGDWKYIAYPGFEPQLFNLEDDPEEQCDLAGSSSQRCREMDAVLRGMVDYETVDAHVKATDRAGFRQWRGEVGEGAYREIMMKTFRGWGDPEFRRIEEWLREG